MNKYGKNYENVPYDSLDDDFELNACSAYDCTGLIPAGISDIEQLQAYEDLYPYLPDEDYIKGDFDKKSKKY